ncbi:MAG: hypothetical protein H0X36_06485 [Sphingomonadaceae bacterium]|nr:hypothetical protein [Sphingomonadaceae bacterium]
MPRRATLLASAALGLIVTGCGGGSSPITATPSPVATTPPPTPTPTPTPTSFSVDACLSQPAQNGNDSVLQLVLPDVLHVDLTRPVAFPNGRRLDDLVIDLTLSRLFLDLSKQSVNTFVNLPLNPDNSPRHFKPDFPYFGDARNATPPIPASTEAGFNFRTDPDSGFVRVDRMGMPAVATVLITPETKVAYNDSNPVDDSRFVFASVERADLEHRMDDLADDFKRLNLAICGTPN